MKLKDLITVRSGLVVTRKATKEDKGYGYQQLTLKSFRPQCSLDTVELTEFKSNSILDRRYLTQMGDVIVRLTAPYTAILIDEETTDLVITSNFVVLRQEMQVFCPRYLWSLMNGREVKRTLEQGTSSTMMGSVKPQAIGALEFQIISMAGQERLGMLHMLSVKEQGLLSELQQEKLKYNRWALETAQRKMRKGDKS